MKIEDILERHEFGTIAKLIPSDQSARQIKNWCQENRVPCIDQDDLHCTVVFSRRPVTPLKMLDQRQLKIPARITGWRKLGTALTMELHSPVINRLHEWMVQQGAKHAHPEYIVHMSIRYNWLSEQIPKTIPAFSILFEKLVVEGINPHFSENQGAIDDKDIQLDVLAA